MRETVCSLAETEEEEANPWLLLERDDDDGTIPVIGAANSMTYVLHLKLGEELVLPQSGGEPLRLRLVATLADCVFQSELLMSEDHFLRLFPQHEGFRYFLLDTAPGEAETVTGVLEQRLSLGCQMTRTPISVPVLGAGPRSFWQASTMAQKRSA